MDIDKDFYGKEYGIEFYDTEHKHLNIKSWRSRDRVTQVIEKIRDGWSRKAIAEHFIKEWNIKYYTFMKYYRIAVKTIAESYQGEVLEDVKAIQLERIQNILQKAITKGDNNTALNALNMINRLYSLYIEKKEIKADINEWKFNYEE